MVNSLLTFSGTGILLSLNGPFGIPGLQTFLLLKYVFLKQTSIHLKYSLTAHNTVHGTWYHI